MQTARRYRSGQEWVMQLSRRSVLTGAILGGVASALPLGVKMAFAAGGASGSNIVVFALMRGAMDGLNMVAPSDDADLIAARPAALRLLSSGTGAALPLANGPSRNDWRLHPVAVELKELYDSGQLAFVHATGIPADSRSHFQMQAFLEHGVADAVALTEANGWIGQYALSTNLATPGFSLVSGSPTLPASMSGNSSAVSMPNPAQFVVGSTARSQFLQAAYGPSQTFIGAQGNAAISAVTSFQTLHKGFHAAEGGDLTEPIRSVRGSR